MCGRQPPPTARGPQRSRGATADRRQAGGRETTGEDGPSSKRRWQGRDPATLAAELQTRYKRERPANGRVERASKQAAWGREGTLPL